MAARSSLVVRCLLRGALFWARLHKPPTRRSRPRVTADVRPWGTWLVVAALAGVGLAATADALRGEEQAPPPARRAATGAENATEEAPAEHEVSSSDGSPSPSRTPAGAGPVESALIGRRELTVGGVPFSFSVTMGGWERFGSISINKSTVGSQGAEAIIFWTSFPDGEYADPCADLISPPVDPSAADLAVAVSKAPGTELVRGPSDVTVGGRAAKHVVLTVREDVGCDPGFFYAWQDVEEGALWPMTDVGDTIRVWIVDVSGTRLFIEAETTKQAGSDLEQEIRQIVESIRFD
jgi:hypothetical protein